MALGKQIKKYREQADWTLADLSLRSGVDIGTINALEVRGSERSKYAPLIAKAFGLSLEQLLDESATHELLVNNTNLHDGDSPAYTATSGGGAPTRDTIVRMPQKTAEWPFRRFTAEEWLLLDYDMRDDIESDIEKRIIKYVRGNPNSSETGVI